MENTVRQFDYFYTEEADQFTFYRIPKKLFTERIFRELSCEAKVLYGLMLDRLSLSHRNNWMDEQGRVYIVYGRREAAEELGCGEKKAGRIISELADTGLIEKKRRGQGKLNLFYVMNFNRLLEKAAAVPERTVPEKQVDCPCDRDTGKYKAAEGTEEPFQKGQNDTSGKVRTTVQREEGQNDTSRKVNPTVLEGSKRPPNKTDKNNTDVSNNNLSIHHSWNRERKDLIRRRIDYDALAHDMPQSAGLLDEIVDLVADVMNAPLDARKKIDGITMPCSDLQEQFGRLDMSHIRYVLECVEEAGRTCRIRNIKAYLLTALYNAPMTINSYYSAMVNHDLYKDAAEGG